MLIIFYLVWQQVSGLELGEQILGLAGQPVWPNQ